MSGFLALFMAGLRSLRRPVLLWSLALSAAVAATVAFWPAFKGASGISEAIDALPAPVVDALGLRDFGSPAGFLRGNLYELLVPLLLSIAGIGLVAGRTAGDESAGRLELLLAEPVARRSLFAARVTACAVGLGVVAVATAAAQLAMDAVVGLPADPGRVLATVWLCALLAAVHGAMAYTVACFVPKAGAAMGIAVAVMLAGYLAMALLPLVSALKPGRAASPWDWALGGSPLQQPTDPWRYLVLAGAALLLALVGTLVVGRRDVAAA